MKKEKKRAAKALFLLQKVGEFMRIPETIKIGGLIYKCIEVENLSRDKNANGASCGNGLYIEIDKSLPEQLKESVLLHEILEQINYIYELELDHKTITTLEAALYQVFKDNFEASLNESCCRSR